MVENRPTTVGTSGKVNIHARINEWMHSHTWSDNTRKPQQKQQHVEYNLIVRYVFKTVNSDFGKHHWFPHFRHHFFFVQSFDYTRWEPQAMKQCGDCVCEMNCTKWAPNDAGWRHGQEKTTTSQLKQKSAPQQQRGLINRYFRVHARMCVCVLIELWAITELIVVGKMLFWPYFISHR